MGDREYAEAAYQRLDIFLINNPTISVDITGHTDNEPSPYSSSSGTGNQALSIDRANFVANELITNYGVNPGQIDQVTGVGATQPRVPNNPSGTPGGTPENRRVSVQYKEF